MSDFLIVNGVTFPTPNRGVQIVSSSVVDSGRNANGEVVGQIIGRKLWKINNLQWTGLSAEQWGAMKSALSPFFVNVTFSGDDGQRHTVTMYPSDFTAEPLTLEGNKITKYKTVAFNLIDCGW